MSHAEQLHLTEIELQAAADNYVDCLNLDPRARVLIVTDAPQAEDEAPDRNIILRRQLSDLLQTRLAQQYQVGKVEFSNADTKEQIYVNTEAGLQGLISGDTAPLTVVYLGNNWTNRSGIYDAADTLSHKTNVSVAGSLGFSTGDARVMSQMGAEQRQKIAEASQYFEDFFTENPQGAFTVTTTYEDKSYTLDLTYDTTQAPFKADLGILDPEYPFKKGDHQYLNIPGGESFAAPFPFTNTKGQFTAEGLVFTVEAGMVTQVDILDANLANADNSQLQFIRSIQAGKPIAIAELGLGYYEIAGIPTYPDCSVLSREKGAVHFGMGNDPGGRSSESETLEKLAGDFYHTDFVTSGAQITFHNPETQEELQFYPPAK